MTSNLSLSLSLSLSQQVPCPEVIEAQSAAATCCWAAPGLLLVQLAGVLTRECLAAVEQGLIGRFGHEMGAWVLDCRAAAIAVSLRDLGGLFDDAAPCAIVCAPPADTVFIAHALGRAMRGRWCRVFRDADQALAWTRARLEMRR